MRKLEQNLGAFRENIVATTIGVAKMRKGSDMSKASMKPRTDSSRRKKRRGQSFGIDVSTRVGKTYSKKSNST